MPIQETVFIEGQRVVYPLQGVGQVKKITKRVFQGKDQDYYEIYLAVSDMTVLVPVDKAEELGIRSIVDKKSAEKALKIFAEQQDVAPADWKLRYQMNLDLLKKGSIFDIAQVVKTLYHRSKIKELPIMERRLYDNALKLLVDEVAYSIDSTKDEVEQLIHNRLEE